MSESEAKRPSGTFIAIGDTVIEPFIRLTEGHIQESAKGTELCIPYGSKIPYESATLIAGVGNSANAAVAAARLGVTSSLVTWLGDDENGATCKKSLISNGVHDTFIQIQVGKTTDYHFVLWYGDDRTILVKHEPFDYTLPDIGSPSWLYISSLASHTELFHVMLTEYAKSHPDVCIAFQPGTFQLKLGKELELYKHTTALCLNKEEAQLLLETDEHDIKALLDGLEALGPKIIIITDGHAGAFMKHDNTYFNMPIYPDIAPPRERTGAGDAFFSTFITYLVKGYDAPYAIARAPINSMNVVQHVGAQEGLLTEEALEELLKRAPTDYKLTILE
jgi:sugar/nucleoside kinase (ribokinase family)